MRCGSWTSKAEQSISARFVISAVGGFVNAKTVIDIDGVGEFGGMVLRPNDWDDSYDIRGKRVAVIGTGASGVQIAGAVSDIAGSVDIYQRTPGWVLPRPDFAIPPPLRRSFGAGLHPRGHCSRPMGDRRCDTDADVPSAQSAASRIGC